MSIVNTNSIISVIRGKEGVGHKQISVYGRECDDYHIIRDDLVDEIGCPIEKLHTCKMAFSPKEDALLPATLEGLKFTQITSGITSAKDSRQQIKRRCKAAPVIQTIENWKRNEKRKRKLSNEPLIPMLNIIGVVDEGGLPLTVENVLSKTKEVIYKDLDGKECVGRMNDLITHAELRRINKLCSEETIDQEIQEIAKRTFIFVKVKKVMNGDKVEYSVIEVPPLWKDPSWQAHLRARMELSSPQEKEYSWRAETNAIPALLRAQFDLDACSSRTEMWEKIKQEILSSNEAISVTSLLLAMSLIPDVERNEEVGVKLTSLVKNHPFFKKENSDALLMHSILQGHEELALGLINFDIGNIAQRNEMGQTPLHSACMLGQSKVALALLDEGAVPHSLDKENLPAFAYAIQSGHKKLAIEILKNHVLPSHLLQSTGRTRLEWACAINDLDLVKTLIDTDGEVNRQDDEGKTLLHRALEEQNYPLACILLEKGAKLDVADLEGITPLHQLILRTIPAELNRVLREKGWNLDELRDSVLLASAWGVDNVSQHTKMNFPLARIDHAFIIENYLPYLQMFLANKRDVGPLSTLDLAPIANAISNRTEDPKCLVEQIQEGKPVVLMTQWDDGSASSRGVIFTKMKGKIYAVKCNIDSGIEVFEVGKAENLTKVIAKLQKPLSAEKGPALFDEKMNAKLGLKKVSEVPLKSSDANNPQAIVDALFSGLTCLKLLETNASEPGKQIQMLQEEASSYVKEQTLSKYLAQEEPHLPLVGEILKKTNDPSLAQRRSQLQAMIGPVYSRARKWKLPKA